MLKAALSGNYVNFGVFRLYGDDALDNALNTFVKLLLMIPQSDLLVSPIVTHWPLGDLNVILKCNHTIRMFPPAIDIIPTLLAVPSCL